VINSGSTFIQVGFQLYSSGANILPVALEQTYGPKPRWRIPKPNTKIPHGIQKIYVVNIQEPFTLALVRSIQMDTPLVVREFFYS